MEFEQLVKRLDWLDEQHRKTKAALDETREELVNLESENKTLRKNVKELSTEMTRLATAAGRMDEYETALTLHRKEVSKFIADLEKRRDVSQSETDKRYRLEFDSLNKPLAEIKKVKESIPELRREIKGIKDEDVHTYRMITEMQAKFEPILRAAEEAQLSIRASEESRSKDVKRLADLQGEVSALRKRLDETRERHDISTDNLRRWEIRLNEIVASEADRRQSQTNFIETQARLQVDQDRTWKEWQERLEGQIKDSEAIETRLQAWDAAQRNVKRAQETYEEITGKFERRINEITEVQRLGEDRFRQEWVSFKADDQKRWTSFTLNQDESRKEEHTDIDKMSERLTVAEDLAQTLQDIIQQTRDADEQMLQAILAQIHELLSSYERIKGTA